MSGLTLTRAAVSLRGGHSRRGSTREYLLHQLVAELFPDRPDRGYVFREIRRQACGSVLLMLSDAPPRAPEELPDYEWGSVLDTVSKPFAPELKSGLVLDFEIRVNATRVRVGPDLDAKGRLKRRRYDVWDLVWAKDRETPLSPADVYAEWLGGKLAGAARVNRLTVPGRGDVPDLHVTERGEMRVGRGDPRISDPRWDRNIPFVVVNLVGSLTVTDPDALLAQISAGLGRARAFGCGLLCLSMPGTVLARRGLVTEP